MEFKKGILRVKIRRQENCPFNLYSTSGMEAYRLVNSFHQDLTPEQAAEILVELGFELEETAPPTTVIEWLEWAKENDYEWAEEAIGLTLPEQRNKPAYSLKQAVGEVSFFDKNSNQLKWAKIYENL